MARKHSRKSAFGDATLIFGDGGKVRCRICDISEGGAKLKMPYTEWLPRLFEYQDRTGIRRHAELAWQGETEIGIRFVEDGSRRRKSAPAFGKRGLPPGSKP